MDFLQTHSLYVVGIIAAVIWLGIFSFLMLLERRISRLERGNHAGVNSLKTEIRSMNETEFTPR